MMRGALVTRIGILAAIVALLEALCLGHITDPLTMPPPHRIARDFLHLLRSGALNGAILMTLENALIALLFAVTAGVAAASAVHRLPTVRSCLDPLVATYYAVPVFAFYPLFIVVFGLGDAPQILIAFMLAVVAVIMSTLDGLDRVPRALAKTARIHRLGSVETAWRVTLPAAAPYILTGVKLAVAYALIGIIGAEFIMSRGGIGYEINFAYNNFDNATMYPLILLVLIVSVGVNTALARWERTLLARRGLA